MAWMRSSPGRLAVIEQLHVLRQWKPSICQSLVISWQLRWDVNLLSKYTFSVWTLSNVAHGSLNLQFQINTVRNERLGDPLSISSSRFVASAHHATPSSRMLTPCSRPLKRYTPSAHINPCALAISQHAPVNALEALLLWFRWDYLIDL